LGRKPNSLRGLWDRAITPSSGRIARTADGSLDYARLLKFLTALQPAIEISSRPKPWQSWRDGDEVLAVLGERDVRMNEVSKRVKQRAVGARDVQTVASLAETLYARLQLNCRVTTHHVPAKMPAGEAVAKLNELRSQRKLGMIVVVGSPVSNPLAEPIAKEILRDGENQIISPVRFRWSFEPRQWFLSERPSRAAPDGKFRWSPSEEGIAIYCDGSEVPILSMANYQLGGIWRGLRCEIQVEPPR
jgi:hypothetical protein